MVKPAPPLLLPLLLGALTVTLVTSQNIIFGQRSGCPTECKYVYDPVCGSDGVSYPNLCFFTRTNCKDTSVRAVKRGSCSVPDPCAFVCDRMYNPMCGSDGVTYANPCVLLYFACYYANGLQPRHSGKCIVERPCPTSCPNDNDPVCGSDGKTYGNPCLLLLEACKGRLLTTTRNGPCNPPQRPCPKSCTFSYAPVCASDGNTYSNQCTLDATNCQGTTTITKIYDGECVRHQKECPASCPANYAPVCGSDGKTYGNQCTLDAASCRDPTIRMQSNGECGTPQRPCPDVCPEVYSPVCGTDGKTYDNDCALKAASCRNPSIILSDSGKCDERPTSTPRCPVSCSRLYEPVCGSDGVTYDNQCLLTRVTCRDPSVTKTGDGPCAPAKGSGSGDSCVRKCPFTYAPVCGSDRVTYSNECTFGNAVCKDPVLIKRYDGTCR